jgi:hypothetical protein
MSLTTWLIINFAFLAVAVATTVFVETVVYHLEASAQRRGS